MVDGTTVYWEQTQAGFRAHEMGVAGPWHEVNERVNAKVYEAIRLSGYPTR